MTVSIEEFKQSVCQNEYKAFLAGAAMKGLGLDLFLVRFLPLGEMPHLALAGAGGVWLTYLTKARRLIAERLVEGLGRIARRDGVILPPKGR